jgi:hypothetical protein
MNAALPARGRATGRHRRLVPAPRVSCQCSAMILPTCTRCAARLTAHELETGLGGQLRQLHESLEPQSTRPPADPDVTAAIERVLKPLPAHHPGAPDAQQEAAAARRVTDVAQDLGHPRGR